jgi:hypothetical protein
MAYLYLQVQNFKRTFKPILSCSCGKYYIKTRECQEVCLFCLRASEWGEENRKYYEKV